MRFIFSIGPYLKYVSVCVYVGVGGSLPKRLFITNNNHKMWRVGQAKEAVCFADMLQGLNMPELEYRESSFTQIT